MSSRKKLYLYRHEANEIVVNSFNAKEWDDFAILNMKDLSWEAMSAIEQSFEQIAIKMNKQLILIPGDLDAVDFYGIEVREEDDEVKKKK